MGNLALRTFHSKCRRNRVVQVNSMYPIWGDPLRSHRLIVVAPTFVLLRHVPTAAPLALVL